MNDGTPAQTSKTLLYIEDDASQHLATTSNLSFIFPHIQVLGAYTSKQAFDHIAAASKIDAVLSDLEFPDLQNVKFSRAGFTVVEEVRKKFPEAQAIILSGTILPVIPEQCAKLKITFLAKPVSMRDLEQHLIRALNEPMKPLELPQNHHLTKAKITR